MAQIDDGLTPQQDILLIQESDSAKHLLAYGLRALRQSAFQDTTRDPVMTMLSIGVEKLLKVALGLLSSAQPGERREAHQQVVGSLAGKLLSEHVDLLHGVESRLQRVCLRLSDGDARVGMDESVLVGVREHLPHGLVGAEDAGLRPGLAVRSGRQVARRGAVATKP